MKYQILFLKKKKKNKYFKMLSVEGFTQNAMCYFKRILSLGISFDNVPEISPHILEVD